MGSVFARGRLSAVLCDSSFTVVTAHALNLFVAGSRGTVLILPFFETKFTLDGLSFHRRNCPGFQPSIPQMMMMMMMMMNRFIRPMNDWLRSGRLEFAYKIHSKTKCN